MGVSWVLNYTSSQQQTTQQIVESFQQRLEALGAKKSGVYHVELETLLHAQDSKKAVHVIQHTEFPLTSFAISDAGTCIVGDATLPFLLQSLSPHYSGRKIEGAKTKIEVKGARYRVSDFVVHIGSAIFGGSVRGIIIEAEYQPCISVVACLPLLQEFVSGLVGESLHDKIGAHLQSRKDQNNASPYTAKDTAHQYLEVLSALRKASALPSTSSGGSASSLSNAQSVKS